MLESQLFGDELEKHPPGHPAEGGSDSATFDNVARVAGDDGPLAAARRS